MYFAQKATFWLVSAALCCSLSATAQQFPPNQAYGPYAMQGAVQPAMMPAPAGNMGYYQMPPTIVQQGQPPMVEYVPINDMTGPGDPALIDAPSLIDQALALHEAGRYADAVQVYESIIFSNPPDPRLYASIADAHFRLNNTERALKYSVEALKLDPAYASGHLLLGTILAEMGDDIRAARSYHKVIALDQNNPYAYYNLGLLHYKKSDIKTAIEYLEKARDLNPNDPKIWNNLGVAYYDQEMMPEAMMAYTEALRLDPGYESAARNMQLVQGAMPPPPPMPAPSSPKKK